MGTTDFILAFASKHPILSFFVICSAYYAITAPFRFGLMAYNRRLRSANIRAQGWPTAPIDADGDVVHPEAKS